MTGPECPFCEIAAGRAPATILRQSGGTLVIVPLAPVTDGHVLVIPKRHVPHVAADPATTALVFGHVALWIREAGVGPCNVITSLGVEATQSVFHLHAHVVPRREGDGLCLPWDAALTCPVCEQPRALA